ncbi:hypothetical protein [Streptomyces sp. MMG1121]|uniref:hypothetical protein n=1 Tax=Streptomyces sp. MMG1121 TaxID=1415544 RepID=UPI0006AEF04A|nr:hypothetical protein [Streptomyces sp. MMG1121]KOV58197.1 hypothetical protein ADK64_37645 [Streptomyces sp. MMG1121]
MRKPGKARRAIALTAATLVLTGGATVAAASAAQAAPASCGTPSHLVSQSGSPYFSCTGSYAGSWFGTSRVFAGSFTTSFVCGDNGTWYVIKLPPGSATTTLHPNDECVEVTVGS